MLRVGRRFTARTTCSRAMSQVGKWNCAFRRGRTLSTNKAESFLLDTFFMATGMEVPRRVQRQSNGHVTAIKKTTEPTGVVCCYCEEMTMSVGAITASWKKRSVVRHQRQSLEQRFSHRRHDKKWSSKHKDALRDDYFDVKCDWTQIHI